MTIPKVRFGIRIQVIVEYMWAFFVILNGNSVYHASNTFDYHFPVICTFLTFLLWLFVCCNRKGKDSKAILMAFSLACYFLLYFVIKYDTITKEIYLLGYVISLPLLFLCFVAWKREGKIELLFYRLEDVVLILAGISLIIWICGPIFNIISPNTDMTIAWGQLRSIEGYFGIQYITQYDYLFANGLVRNTSIFCEGPMFALWLSIALSTEMFLRKTSSRRKILLLVVTILTTTTLTGISCIVLCCVLKLLVSTESVKKKRFVIFSFLVMVLLPMIFFAVQDIILQKMTTSSYLIRMQDYIAGFLVWKEKPIFGSGFGSLWSLQEYVLSGFTTSVGFSNSITAILATGGLWNFVIYVLGIVAPIFGRYKGKKKMVAFSLVYCFLTITTIFFARYIAVVYIAFGLANFPIFNKSSD